MPKYHGHKIILGVIPNIFHPAHFTTYRSHDSTPRGPHKHALISIYKIISPKFNPFTQLYDYKFSFYIQ